MPTKPPPPGRGVDTWIAGSFAVGLAGAIGFIVVAWRGGQTQWAGVCVFVAAAGMALGLGMWARAFMPGGGQTEPRHALRSDERERAAFAADFEAGGRVLSRRGLVGGLFGAGLFASALGALLPLRSLGPNPDGALRHTDWRRGTRAVTANGEPLRPVDLDEGSAVTIFPEGAVGSADSQAVLVRCGDVPFRARPVFGPATRSLPQLPLRIDRDGYLVAGGDFSDPIGPGSWHR
jgi:ubiquinol-cytochrome c reductase iron-sulfur subunit